MGNTHQSMPNSGAQYAGGPSTRVRRPSTSEPGGPLELPMAHNRYNTETPPSSQVAFGSRLVENITTETVEPDEFVGRYRAGSISMQQPPPKARKPKVLPTVIKWEKEGKEVFIAGTFNNWERKIPLVKSEHNFYTIIELGQGTHEYKFFVDGEWRHNSRMPSTENSGGVINNVIEVKPDDFDLANALETDSVTTKNTGKALDIAKTGHASIYPEEEYNSVMPERRSSDKLTGPPLLPPQLLQVILNKDIPAHLEPGILPEPNHVMLNHLYALSIKDGVMVLSDTSRYKKKYVTTLLYKPISS